MRERPDDIVVIANHLLYEIAKEHGRGARAFAPDALAAISIHGWPGNVRELQNRLKRAVVTATGSRITLDDLDLPESGQADRVRTLKEAREVAERNAITAAMTEADGNITKAAKILKTSRPTVYQLLQQHDIKL